MPRVSCFLFNHSIDNFTFFNSYYCCNFVTLFNFDFSTSRTSSKIFTNCSRVWACIFLFFDVYFNTTNISSASFDASLYSCSANFKSFSKHLIVVTSFLKFSAISFSLANIFSSFSFCFFISSSSSLFWSSKYIW